MAEFVLSGQELFGRYARIAYGHALDGKQDYHIYKCIRSFMSNCYCDVPLTYQTENNCYKHENIVDVVNVIHCGIDENRVIRVALNDIELLPAPDVEPVQEWIPVDERLPECEGSYIVYTERGSIYASHFYTEKRFASGYVREAQWSQRGTVKVTHWMPLPLAPEDMK